MRKMFSKNQIAVMAQAVVDNEISSKGLKKVQANPTLAGTESALTSLLVGSTKYRLPSDVIANPSPAGSTELSGLQIGNNKYKIAGGTKLYGHEVLVTMSNETRLSIQVVSVTPTISTGFVDEPSMAAILQAGIIAMYIDETYVPVKQSDLVGAEEAEVLEDYEIPYNE